MMINKTYFFLTVLSICDIFLLIGCADATEDVAPVGEEVAISMSLTPFEGEVTTRTNIDGTSFEGTEQIRMRIICPHSSHHENGELWSSSFHNIDLSSASNSGNVWIKGTIGAFESQATTYIYSAQNTTDTRIFVIDDYRYTRYSNFFFADQSKLEYFKKSDVLWAQAIRQTGAREVHLNFKHKVAKLDITIDDSELSSKLTANSILTLEGMPDIDGAEIVVGDYYADDSYEDESYSYKQKASCNYVNNGKVLGIEVIDETAKRSKIWPMSGNPSNPGGKNSSVFNPNSPDSATPVPNTGVYTAYHDPSDYKHFLLYVPVCDLDRESVGGKNATFWIREGSRRYSAQLNVTNFEEGMCYKTKLTFGDFSPSNTY